jgi:hypothetical protein
MPHQLRKCSCTFKCSSYSEMLAHHRECSVWQSKLGQCPLCKRRYYRHIQDCPNEGEDLARRRLLERHEIDPEEFEVVLRVLARRYPKIVHSPLVH